jgi:hypothetical protein|tara:strand:- start:340 stop:651 length:312 start_codon:yes stop_codon:yes gene_type:complete
LEEVVQLQHLLLIKEQQEQFQLFQQLHQQEVVRGVVARDQLVQVVMVDQLVEEHQAVEVEQVILPQLVLLKVLMVQQVLQVLLMVEELEVELKLLELLQDHQL